MRLYEVRDLGFLEKNDTCNYDWAFFASGYESRCTNAIGRLSSKNAGQVRVFRFEDFGEDKCRKANDEKFRRWHDADQTPARSNDDAAVVECLHEIDKEERSGAVSILIDYTSMSRLWYSSMLNWARFSSHYESIVCDFIYSPGYYPAGNRPAVIKDILAIPGLEGRVWRRGRSVAVFGLGGDGYASLCVLDRLEPRPCL